MQGLAEWRPLLCRKGNASSFAQWKENKVALLMRSKLLDAGCNV